MRVLTLNGGSSSVKFGVYTVGDTVTKISTGEIEHPHAGDDLFGQSGEVRPDAIGHRIVHGGIDLFAPVLIDDDVLGRLQRATAFAPLRAPAALASWTSTSRQDAGQAIGWVVYGKTA